MCSSLGYASSAYGVAEDARIRDIGAKSGSGTPALLSSATAASIDDAMPACTVVDVRSTTAATAIDLVAQPDSAIAFHVWFIENQRNVMYETKAAVPKTLRTSRALGNPPILRRICMILSALLAQLNSLYTTVAERPDGNLSSRAEDIDVQASFAICCWAVSIKSSLSAWVSWSSCNCSESLGSSVACRAS